MLYPVTAPENILFRQQLKNLSLHYRTEIIAALSQCILKGFHLTSLDLLCSCPDTNEAAIISELRRTGLQFPRPYLSIKTEFTIGMDKDIEECSRRGVGLRSLAYSLIICYSIFFFFFLEKIVFPNQHLPNQKQCGLTRNPRCCHAKRPILIYLLNIPYLDFFFIIII